MAVLLHFLLWLSILSAPSAYAESLLMDDVNEFTDERQLKVIVLAEDADDSWSAIPPSLAFGCNFRHTNTTILLAPHAAFHVGDTIPVVLRFDKEPAIRDEWWW